MKYIHTVQYAIDYIEDHLFEPLELQHIADKAYMSVPHLYRAFYSLTGHPIKEYIRKRRISMSSMHLRHSDKLVWDIAYECGFDSYQTFTKMFKKVVGMTPGTYRNADIYYTFEAVNLLADVSYVAEKELFERHPDVSVIRFPPMRTAVYRHQASEPEGIEEEAFRIVFAKLERLGWDMERIRFFGTNVELPSAKKPHGYDMMIPLPETNLNPNFDPDEFRITTFPGGLYAVGRSSETSGPKIVAAWDRLLSEWLPRSTFELGDHTYVEQFLTYQGNVTRMKLYLPVKRKLDPATLETVHIDPIAVFTCRAYGPDAQKLADNKCSEWLIGEGMAGMTQLRLFMSYSYGVEPDEGYWYELSVSVPEHQPDAKDGNPFMRAGIICGGLYAYLTAGAYGLMTGLLDRMHRWLYRNETYALDENRQWFAEYIAVEGPDLERSTSVKCYIPIIEQKGGSFRG